VLSELEQDLLFDFGSKAESLGFLRLTLLTSALRISRFRNLQAAAKHKTPFYFG
jgi:hypothetical protein